MGATGGGNHSTRGIKDLTKTQPLQSEGAADERTKTNSYVDAERSYPRDLEDGGVGGGNRLTGFDISTDLLEEGGNRSSGTASSDEDNNSSSLGGVADERSKTNSHYDADAHSNDYGYLTVKDNVSEVGTARRSSSFHGLIRRTWRWRYVKISIGTSSTGSWRQIEEDGRDIEDI